MRTGRTSARPAIGSNASGSRTPASTSRSGRAASASQSARPMPRLAPVTRAVRVGQVHLSSTLPRSRDRSDRWRARPVATPMLRTATFAVLGLRVAYGAALIAAPERLALRWLGPPPARRPPGAAARPRRARDRRPRRRDRRRAAGQAAAPVPRRERGGRPRRHRRHRRRAAAGCPMAPPRDARRRRRIGAAHRGPRCRPRALTGARVRPRRDGPGARPPASARRRPARVGAGDRATHAERDVIASTSRASASRRRSTAAGRRRRRRSPPRSPAALPDEPYHVAGNSLGGWVALELAAAGHARSVTAIAPAGLWPEPLAPKRGIARGARGWCAPGSPRSSAAPRADGSPWPGRSPPRARPA